MSRKQIIAGNWKLQNTVEQSVALAKAVAAASANAKADVVVAPVFTAIASVAAAVQGTPVAVAAQDVYWQEKGAFTGEVSASLLKDAGASYGIVGHSERRQFFGETDETVRKKTRALIAAGIVPIVCVGESLEHREQNASVGVSVGQVAAALAGLEAKQIEQLVIAYEPVWAIGTGKTATPADAQAVHAALRNYLSHAYGDATAQKVRILYGGSMKADNAKELLSQPDIDGGLVGGASLVAEQFVAIIAAAR